MLTDGIQYPFVTTATAVDPSLVYGAAKYINFARGALHPGAIAA